MRKGFNPLDPRDIFPEITNNTEDSNNYTGINSCYVGYQCEIDQETQSVEIDGMDFSYSGDRENEEYATIAHSNKDVDVWLVSYGVSSGEVTLTYGEVMSACNDTTVRCSPCTEFTSCAVPSYPSCDGTDVVVCVYPSPSPSPSPSPEETTTTTTTEEVISTTTEEEEQVRCYDIDYQHTDRDGYSCALGYTDQMFCANYDDEDFSSIWMCCTCGT